MDNIDLALSQARNKAADSRLNERKAGRGYSTEWKTAGDYVREGLTPQQGYERAKKYFDESKAQKIKRNMEIHLEDKAQDAEYVEKPHLGRISPRNDREARDAEPAGAYGKGLKAHKDGKKLTDNPFPQGSRDYNQWRNGYKQSEQGEDAQDYRSERGFVARVLGEGGKTLEESELMISRQGAQRWLEDRLAKLKRLGRAVQGTIRESFADPAYIHDIAKDALHPRDWTTQNLEKLPDDELRRLARTIMPSAAKVLPREELIRHMAGAQKAYYGGARDSIAFDEGSARSMDDKERFTDRDEQRFNELMNKFRVTNVLNRQENAELDLLLVKRIEAGKGARDSIAFDEVSARSKDVDGRLHVDVSNISKATVNPYKGSEIPDYESLGLDKDKTYQLLRHPDELEKAAPTFNKLPLLSKHIPLTADTHKSEFVIGTTGTDASFEFPYLKNSLAVWTKPGIDSIESDEKKELSSAYRYKADMTPGVWDDPETGQKLPFDGVMRDIVGNHLALVREGRAGHDVVVGDSKMSGVVAGGRRKRRVMARMTKTAASGIALMGSYLRPKLAQDAKIDLAPVFKGLTLKNLDERRPEIIREIRKLTKGKLAQDASIGEIAEVLDLLEAHPDTGEDAPVTDTQEAMMSELTTVPGAAQASGSGSPGGDRRRARDNRRGGRDNFPPGAKAPPFEKGEDRRMASRDDLPEAERENEEVEGLDRHARDDDPSAAVEAFLKDKVSGADLQHVCNLMRGGEAGEDDSLSDGGDAENKAGEEKLEELGAAEGEDDQGGESDIERSRQWHVGEGEHPVDDRRARDRRPAEDRRGARDKRAKDKRAHDQPPPFKGVPQVGKGPMDKRAMDAAIKAVVEEERKAQRDIRKAEREVRPWVGDLAMDEAMSSEDVYRIALTTLGVKGLDKIHPSAFPTILSYQPKPGATRHHTPSGQRVAMDAATQRSFRDRFPDVERIRVI
jgi:hypothetical protein